MTPKRHFSARSVILNAILMGVVMLALVTSFMFSLWLSRTFTPKGEWLANGLTAFGYPVCWLLLTLLYASLMASSTKWLFRLLWPPPPNDDHE